MNSFMLFYLLPLIGKVKSDVKTFIGNNLRFRFLKVFADGIHLFQSLCLFLKILRIHRAKCHCICHGNARFLFLVRGKYLIVCSNKGR
jgi:accessory gene regulator protein AgrB